jgi:hypothetical protein
MKVSKPSIAVILLLLLAMAPSAIAADRTSVKAAGPSQSITVNTIRSGAGAPSNSLGNNGDFYIDTKTLNLYGPKVKGLWKLAVSLRPKEASVVTPIVGETGATGATGSQGDKGDKGATGDKGDKGVTGDKGLTGLTGATGSIGSIGATGTAGFNGATGLKGDAGAAGATGATGLKGDAGAAGATGPTGATGATGPTGPTGLQGLQGTQGAKGDTGTAGAVGATGDAGISNSKFVTVPTITLATGADGNNSSSIFFTADVAGNYTFEILLNGLVDIPDKLKIYAEITTGSLTIGNQFAIASDSTSGVNGISGRQYGLRIIGVAASVSAGTAFSVRIGILNAADSVNLNFSGRALINKVGSIG